MRGRKDPLRGVTCGVTCKSWQTRRPPPREPGPDEAQVIGRRGGARGPPRSTSAGEDAERGPGRARLAQRERHLVGPRLEPAERELAGAVDEGDVADPRRVPASTATAGRMRPVASRTVPGVKDDPGGVVDRRFRTGIGAPAEQPRPPEKFEGMVPLNPFCCPGVGARNPVLTLARAKSPDRWA